MLDLIVKTCSSGMGVLAAVLPAATQAETTTTNLRIVNPAELYDPAPNGYSHAVVASNIHNIAYIAGQGGRGYHRGPAT